MAKKPSFPFYYQDFLTGTLDFSTEEIGAYVLLLCRQWDKYFVLENEAESVARIPSEKLKKVLAKFKKRNGKLINFRLEIIRKEIEEFSKMQSSKGRSGANKRWNRPSSGHAPAINRPMPENSFSSSSSSSIESKEKNQREESLPTPTDAKFFDAEQIILAEKKRFQEICMVTYKSETDAKAALRKYHLHLEEKERYPMTKKSMLAGFEKWLRGEWPTKSNSSGNPSIINPGSAPLKKI